MGRHLRAVRIGHGAGVDGSRLSGYHDSRGFDRCLVLVEPLDALREVSRLDVDLRQLDDALFHSKLGDGPAGVSCEELFIVYDCRRDY